MPNWKKVIISGSDAALNSLEITSHLTASGLIYPTSDGTNGQAITTDAAGNLTFGNPGFADEAEKVTFEVQNGDAGTLAKGTPVHITSMTGGTAIVVAASASVASKMPSHGILNQQLTVGSDGFATILGQVTGVNTSAFSPGDTVYVGSSGGYTNVKPAGSTNLIQNLGVVKIVDASNGTGEIFGSGRTNDVPNLPTGKIWVGATDYTVTSSVVHLDEPNSRLGIGTTSPATPLHVDGGNVNNVATFESTDDTARIILKDNDTLGYFIAKDNVISIGGSVTTANNLNVNITSNNVGIGTTNPGANLEIAKGSEGLYLKVGGDNASNGRGLTFSSGPNNGSIGALHTINATSSNGAISLNTAGVSRLFLDRLGNVGIGTTSPSAKLHVTGSGSTSATTALLVEDNSGSDLLKVNDLGNVTIPNGSLSLNGATGTEELNIAGNIAFDSPGGTISGGGVGASLNLSAAGANISIGSANNNIVMTGGVTGSFSGSFEGDGSNLTGITAEWDGSHNGDAEITGSLVISGSSADLTVTGNVGIGTSSPSTKFHLAGGIARFDNASSNYLEIDGSNASSNNAIISNRFNQLQFVTNTGAGTPHIALLPGTGGNVGIGTTSPDEKLVVAGTIKTIGDAQIQTSRNFVLNSSNSYRGGLYADQLLTGDVSDSLDDVVLYSANGSIHLTEGATTNKVLTVSGSSVGIGTTSPGDILHVSKAGAATRVRVGNNAAHDASIYFNTSTDWSIGTDTSNSNSLTFGNSSAIGTGTKMVIKTNGNVGIGTTNPSEKLDVDGNAVISGSLELYNGALLVSGSNDSTYIGADGEIELGFEAQPVKLNRNKFVLVNSGPDVVATVDSTLHLSAHFDYVIVKLPNLRAGTVMACHDSLGNVVFTETATSDLGSTAGVALDVVEIGGNLELRMTVPSTGWLIKTFVRAI